MHHRTVTGNHEDKSVVERLFHGDLSVHNLHILHHRQAFEAGEALLFGLGGNFLSSSKLTNKPIAGGGGKIWSTLSQYVDLVEVAETYADWPGHRIFVSHVSPGKEPFVELIGTRTRADLTISGHMGAPQCMVWNPFAIRSAEEAHQHLLDGLEAARTACQEAVGPDARWIEEAFAFLEKLPQDTIHMGRGVKAPRWYRAMTHINLPDAHIGHAVLDLDGGKTRLQTFAS